MKKISKIIILICMLITITLLTMLFLNKKEEKVLTTKKESKSNFISMMVEQDDGSYKENKDINFLNEGYMFNQEKSGCENGGVITWNSTKEKVETSLLTSDKCYAYFEKYNFEKSCLQGYENSLECEIFKNKDNTLIYHDGKADYPEETNYLLEAEDYSYRYTGGNPNNFICFGGECSDDPNDENYINLYRIVGLFDDNKDGYYNLKIIRADYATETEIGGKIGARNPSQGFYQGYTSYKGNYSLVPYYYWNNANNSASTNDWTKSSLNKINLNDYFINTYLKNKDNSKWLNMIIDYDWIIEGNVEDNIINNYIKETYKNEIVKATKSTKTKIGLMYVSDYGYAAESSIWNLRKLGEYNDSSVIDNNWLYLGLDEWVITPNTDYTNVIYRIWFKGNIITGYVFADEKGAGYTLAIRPTFYLNSNIEYLKGNGTLNDPYCIV